MGKIFHMTCRNKACRYRVELREGEGMRLFAWVKSLERDILSGKEAAPEEIINLLKNGNELECVATYLCPSCHEWQVGTFPYVLEKIRVSPYGTIREYKVHYLNGKPKCEKCGAELEYILNPRSGKNKCPKCGTDNMRVSHFGHYD